jgi:hypothetical protein
MRIAVISVCAKRNGSQDCVKALAGGMESMGHHVEILDAWTEDGYKLPSFEYIAICAEPASFWGGKMPAALSKILSSTSSLGGKKSAAFLKKTGPLFVNKALGNLMRAMEKEGMMVNWSDILLSTAHATAMGKRIGS